MIETTMYLFNADDFAYLESIGFIEKAKQNGIIVKIDDDLDCISVSAEDDFTSDIYCTKIENICTQHRKDITNFDYTIHWSCHGCNATKDIRVCKKDYLAWKQNKEKNIEEYMPYLTDSEKYALKNSFCYVCDKFFLEDF